jgi:hypothetical protein
MIKNDEPTLKSHDQAENHLKNDEPPMTSPNYLKKPAEPNLKSQKPQLKIPKHTKLEKIFSSCFSEAFTST